MAKCLLWTASRLIQCLAFAKAKFLKAALKAVNRQAPRKTRTFHQAGEVNIGFVAARASRDGNRYRGINCFEITYPLPRCMTCIEISRTELPQAGGNRAEHSSPDYINGRKTGRPYDVTFLYLFRITKTRPAVTSSSGECRPPNGCAQRESPAPPIVHFRVGHDSHLQRDVRTKITDKNERDQGETA